jgi:hypothetical protein
VTPGITPETIKERTNEKTDDLHIDRLVRDDCCFNWEFYWALTCGKLCHAEIKAQIEKTAE